MSPLASGMVLPCSDESSRASESISSWISCRNRISTRARRCGFHDAHSFWASAAFAIAASVSDRSASGTRACTCPVLGSKTSANLPDVPGIRLPPMK